jgi:hypothetical protein
MQYTHDESIVGLPEYKAVYQVIRSMVENGIIQRLQHSCVAASELISSMLLHEGIESKLVECVVSVKNNNVSPPGYTFIGYDGLTQQEQIDVHVVVITQTKTPLLIDVAIPYALSEETPYVVGKLEKVKDNNILADFSFNGFDIRYNLKKQIKLPSLHQKSILQKIKDDEAVKEKLRTLQIFVWIIAAFAAINFTLNMTAVILKIIYL